MVTISISAEALAAIASTLPDKVALRGIIGNPTSIRLVIPSSSWANPPARVWGRGSAAEWPSPDCRALEPFEAPLVALRG
jgi:hypothetical protein